VVNKSHPSFAMFLARFIHRPFFKKSVRPILAEEACGLMGIFGDGPFENAEIYFRAFRAPMGVTALKLWGMRGDVWVQQKSCDPSCD